ncbi:unnamed protein product [Calypogeia fissa]
MGQHPGSMDAGRGFQVAASGFHGRESVFLRKSVRAPVSGFRGHASVFQRQASGFHGQGSSRAPSQCCEARRRLPLLVVGLGSSCR